MFVQSIAAVIGAEAPGTDGCLLRVPEASTKSGGTVKPNGGREPCRDVIHFERTGTFRRDLYVTTAEISRSIPLLSRLSYQCSWRSVPSAVTASQLKTSVGRLSCWFWY
jgi:hypothetical protein